jgi:hypothetical protein
MSIISFIFIYLIHYLLTFFKSTLTVPKVKDLVNMPTQKYQEMYNIINNGKTIHLKNDGNNNGNNNGNNDENNNSNYTLIDLLPKQETNMKNELKSFLKSQLHGNNNTHDNNNIDTYDNNHVSYSSFT